MTDAVTHAPPGPDPFVLEPSALLDHIAKRDRVSLPISTFYRKLSLDPDDPAHVKALRSAIDHLKSSGDLVEWISPRGKDCVCLTPGAAALRGLRAGDRSAEWLKDGEEEPAPTVELGKTIGGRRIIYETDMSEEPPGSLASVPDRRIEIMDDPDHGLARIIAKERKAGLIRPTLPLVGVKPWIAEDWERDHDKDGKPFPGGGLGPEPKVGKPPCPVCHGRPMRAMWSLLPVRVGRNRKAEPPKLVEGGEACARCAAHFQDKIWPTVYKLPLEPKGEPKGKVAR